MNNTFQEDEDFWNKLSATRDILKLFADKMTLLQKENLTLTDSLGCWIEIKARLEKIKDCPFATELLENLNKRMTEKNILDNDVTLSAIYLDLRFHLLLTPAQKAKAEAHLTYLHQKMSTKLHTNARESAHELRSSPAPYEETDHVLELLMREKESLSLVNHDTANATDDLLLDEMRKFRLRGRTNVTSDVMQNWRAEKFNFPILFELAKMFMAVAPTEVSVERNFSTLDFILNKRRNRMLDENLEMILFVKLNNSLFQDAFEKGELIF